MIRSSLKRLLNTTYLSLLVWAPINAESWLPWSCDSCYDNQYLKGAWFDAEYLYWGLKECPEDTPFLLSNATTPLVRTPIDPNGLPLSVIPYSTYVLGGHDLGSPWRSGGRFALGYWFDDSHTFGVEANYLFLPKGSSSHTESSDGSASSPFLAVPYYDVLTDTEDFTAVASAGEFAGTATLKLENCMQGAELNGLSQLPCLCGLDINLLAGFRFWSFDEQLTFNVSSPYIPPAIPPTETNIYLVEDLFRVKNNFYGGQFGVSLNYLFDQFFVNVKGKVALGEMREKLKINGSLIANDYDGYGAPQTFVGGYFALPTNIGTYRRNSFAVIPEVNVNLGYQVLECLRVKLGYTFLYASNVLRAGKQVNPNVNPTQSVVYENTPSVTLSGEASPQARLKSSSFWAQGISVGAELNF